MTQDLQPNDITDALYDAALGCLLGAAVGDAAGATLEFLNHRPSPEEVTHALSMPGGGVWRVAPGQITDDSELMISLARALAKSNNFDLDKIAGSYADWVRSAPFDIGTTTRTSLGCFREYEWKELCEIEGYAFAMTSVARDFSADSKANGSLMRIMPLGVWGYRLSTTDLALYAKNDASLSHPNSSCCQAAACYVIAIATLIKERGNRELAFANAKTWAEDYANNEVNDWLTEAEQNIELAYYPQIGFVRIAFTHAFRHLKLGSDYIAALTETLRGGGDTDTNAAIVGGLIGAAVGAEKIPAEMRAAVLNCDTEKGRKRPDFLHPRQLPELVEKMLRHAPE